MDYGGFHNHEFNFNDDNGKKLTKKQAKYLILAIIVIIMIFILGGVFL